MPLILEAIGAIVIIALILIGLYRWFTAFTKLPDEDDK